jgi:hypothetical protein
MRRSDVIFVECKCARKGRAKDRQNLLRGPRAALHRPTDRFKPAAYIDLRMSFAAEVAGGGTHRGHQFPLDEEQLLIPALDDEPVGRVLTDDPANFTLKFFQS